MANIPLGAAGKRQAFHGRPQAVGPPVNTDESSLLRRLFRHRLLLVLSVAVGLGAGVWVRSELPYRYVAEARVLLDDEAKPPLLDLKKANDIGRQVVADLALVRDPEFNPALQTTVWWKTPEFLGVGDWLQEQTGIVISGMQPPPDLRGSQRSDDPVMQKFWSHVDLSMIGRPARILEIRTWSRSADRAVALADDLVRRQSVGGMMIAPSATLSEPDYPSETTVLWLAALGGLVFGIIFVLLFDRTSGVFLGSTEIENAANLPVVALVPTLTDGKAAIASVLREPLSYYAESLRALFDGLAAGDREGRAKIVGIASALPGEGRSTLAVSLGRLMAGEGKQVLLIDCDWRHPDLHRLLRVSNDIGLTSLLADTHIPIDDAINTDALSGLDFITAGHRNRQTLRLLISDRMRQILAACAKGYELVLLDMPPVLTANESVVLSALADRILFAIRWGRTRRKHSLGAIEQILNAQGYITGAVLTCVDIDRYRKYQTKNRKEGALSTPKGNLHSPLLDHKMTTPPSF